MAHKYIDGRYSVCVCLGVCVSLMFSLLDLAATAAAAVDFDRASYVVCVCIMVVFCVNFRVRFTSTVFFVCFFFF